ncbi:DNA topoisomerase III [Rhodovulum sp. P5]|uniref:VPLPA-CTERM sorting domain-containing protein n=1 Tax=Rhodovulum sp. P5 TaxID=1564506 RepID=UPI0009C2C0B2|nr:VPLPA-CTERM sorting domain-containing protein [Rhodovulum sp. P5]ARE38695.1 DNA topoisomerase III [Rhodovulum sp. P5]
MKKMLISASALAFFGTGAMAAQLDLTGFSAYCAGSCNWVIAGDGLSVTQTVNGAPTAYVSGDSFINSSFEGSFRTSNGDDDFMGFVFGFGADDSSPFYLFDWKGNDQSGSADGFYLSRVTGGLSAIPFGNHHLDAAGYDVIATDVDPSGDTKRWYTNDTYNFKLTYQTNRILIEVAEEGDPLATIFDITPADVDGVTAFEEGRFGFYNFSQPNVTYIGFTEEQAPPDVPLPATLPLVLAGLGAMGVMGRRKRA